MCAILKKKKLNKKDDSSSLYNKSYEVATKIYFFTKKLPQYKNDTLIGYLRATSIEMVCLVSRRSSEGKKEYAKFLKSALDKTYELETQLLLAKDTGLCKYSDTETIFNLNLDLRKMFKKFLSKTTKTR